ncbi:MAG: class I SAM-dependent RNA methyltransferase, partial [Verrucomicrobia bacterium]|nr:class I SAM-dependent RNA methyltransferase [Verrucomicrobiota bacterium]
MSDSAIPSATLEVGNTVQVVIHDLAFGGEGVARVEDFVVFVPFVIPGEEVEVEITEVKKKFARARLVRVVKPSPDRVEPHCRYFGECGGCQYQHISYDAQLAFKRKQIADLFQRIGSLDPAVVAPVVPCPQPYGYRNRIMVRSQWSKPEQRLLLGFLGVDDRFVVDIAECAIAEPALNEQLKRVRENPPQRGGLKVTLRIPPEKWSVPRDSFFQNNFFLLAKLVETARERLRDAGSQHLVDAYCGVGFFALELADLVKSFVGVEVDEQAIRAAKQNQTARGIKNGQFVSGFAEDYLGGLLQRHPGEPTALLMDPPRTGCPPEALQRVRRAGPQQILYVSCHPATLARDLKLLCEGGAYELAAVVPHDMFPQTQHVECI